MRKTIWQTGKIADKYYVLSSTGYVIAQAGTAYNDKTKMENMMLCAAAPDMLRALQLALRDAEKGGFCQQTFDDVRAAIARATGAA